MLLIQNNHLPRAHRFRGIIHFFKKGIFFKVLIYLLVFLFFFQMGYIYFCKYYYPPLTFIQLGIRSKYKHQFIRKYVDGDKISPYMKLAVVAAEDATYIEHTGFSWEGIEKAIKYNKAHPNKIKGASTISQQTAKNVFLWGERSWFRKVLEVYFTTIIEWMWGKKRIMDVYLNVIEMGPGIIGVEAASLYYFHKHANEINIDEAAMLASCLPNPKFLNPINPTVLLQRKHRRVLRDMFELMNDEKVKEFIK